MRLMTADKRRYPVLRAFTELSERAGTKNVYKPAGHVTGQLSPATDSFSVGLYGDKAASMYKLITECSEDIVFSLFGFILTAFGQLFYGRWLSANNILDLFSLGVFSDRFGTFLNSDISAVAM